MRVFLLAARLWTAIALVVNAIIHFQLAAPFDGIVGTLVSQGTLFRIQAVVDIAAAVLILVLHRWWTAAIAAVVAAGGLALLVISVVVPLDLQFIGLPVIFEPVWYSDKVIAAVAQAVALVGATAIAVHEWRVRAAGKRT